MCMHPPRTAVSPCRYNNLKYSSRSKDWATKLDPVPDIEDLVSVGRGHTLCPFFMSKDAAKVRRQGHSPVGGCPVGPAAHGAELHLQLFPISHTR